MAKRRARSLGSTALAEAYLDFSGGIFGGHSDAGVPMRHLRLADNVEFDPHRAIGVRKGYLDFADYVLAAQPHSIFAWYGTASAKVFVGAADKIYEVTTAGFVEQTLPVTPTSGKKWCTTNLHGILVAVQETAPNVPIFYDGTSWLSSAYPQPAAPTFNADSAGGAVDAGTRYYRVRWRFKNGISIASVASAAHTVAGPNNTVNVVPPAASVRADFVGWTIERTRAAGTTAGPWYFVADGTAAAYADTASDGANTALIRDADPGLAGAAPTLEGVVAFRNRLVGWKESDLYVSQEIADLQGSGILNFRATQTYPVEKEDGDNIKQILNTTGDRLAILKQASGHGLEGDDPSNFRITRLWGDVGAAGPRAAAIIAGTLVFYGGYGRLFRVTSNGPEQWGEMEVGHYLKTIDSTRDADVCLFNYRGRYLLVAYTAVPDTYNRHVLAYRPERRNWTHWVDMRIADAIAPKRPSLFGGRTFIFADPKLVPGSVSAGIASRPSFHLWNDNRVTPEQWYVQKVVSTGQAAWTADGVLVSGSTGGSFIPDQGAVYGLTDGGCVVLYAQHVGSRVLRAQRFDTTGAKLWGADGVLIANANTSPGYCKVITDGGSGFIFFWTDFRSGEQRIYAQRVDASGVIQWAANGLTIADDFGSSDFGHRNPNVLPDGSGGAYVVWGREDSVGNRVLMAQRINSSGARQWGATGVSHSTGVDEYAPMCVSTDGFLHVLLVSTSSVSVRRLNNTTGAAVWTSANLDAGLTVSYPGQNFLVAGASGSVFAMWAQEPSGTATGSVVVRCQRVDSAGLAVWTGYTTVKTFASLTSSQRRDDLWMRAVQDGSGNMIAVLMDPPGGNLYAYRVNADGTMPWGSERVVSDLANPIDNSGVVVQQFGVITDGGGGAIVSFREDAAADTIRVARVRSNGTIEWNPGGLVLCNATGQRFWTGSSFSGANEAQFPSGTTTGYHVWSGFSGYVDEGASNGTGGRPIVFFIETPEIDDGQPDIEKELQRLELYLKSGLGAIAATLTLDTGRVISVPLAASRSTAKWGGGASVKSDTLIWGPRSASSPFPENPRTWAGTKRQELAVGLPNSTQGRSYRLGLAMNLTSELVLVGFCLDWRPLPERPYT